MATNTPIYQFRKPVDADDVDPLIDLGNNWDKVETALNAQQNSLNTLNSPLRGKWNRPITQGVGNASVDIIFTAELSDVGINLNVPFSNFSVPSNGIYSITCATGWNNVGAGDLTRLAIYKNGQLICADANTPLSPYDYQTTHSVSATDYFVTSDVLKISAYSTEVAATLTVTVSSDSIPPTLTVVKVV